MPRFRYLHQSPAGNWCRGISSAIVTAFTVRYLNGVFTRWGFVTGKPHRDRHGRMDTERLIGSIRRECLDHVVVFGERHLRQVLLSYMHYYNGARTHLSLNKDAPLPRSVEAVGRILPTPILGGLHHQYVRI